MSPCVELGEDTSSSAGWNDFGLDSGSGTATRGADATHMQRLTVWVVKVEPMFGFSRSRDGSEIMVGK